MAVDVSKEYTKTVYSGGAINRATLTINGTLIPNSNIKKITISSPIIDKTKDYFYIGTFLAQKVEIEFKNTDEIDLSGIVLLSINTKTNSELADEDGYEEVDIGQYYIDTTPEDYYKMSKITCYDKSILFKQNVDISQWFTNGTITAENLLINLCKHFLGENMLGSYPNLNKNVTTGFYDNTKSGKYYISKIAEIMGANAKIGRDGKLYLIPLKPTGFRYLYTELDYIESDGDQYIDLGFKANQDTRAIIKAQATDEGTFQTGYRLFGARNSASRRGFFISTSSNKLYFDYDNQGSTISTFLMDNNLHTYDFNKNNVYVDETLIKTFNYTEFTNQYNLNLFGGNSGGTIVSKSWKIYSFKLYDNDVLIRDLIPCYRNSDNEVGMYDKVNNEFYTNDGTGIFVAGNESVSPIKINALKSKSWELSSRYKISRVFWENGDIIYQNGNTNFNSLSISTDNIFINGDDTNIQGIVDNLYNELNGFEMWSIKNENYGDVSLDCWDLLEFTLGEETYYALNDNIITYEMNIATTINPIIPSKQKQEVTNIVGKTNDSINVMKTEIDAVNNRVTQTNTRVGSVESELAENVYTKEETNQLIRDAENGLTNVFTKSGGNNLLTNTAPYRVTSSRTLESWTGEINTISEPESVIGTALKLLDGISSQSVDILAGTYAIGFKYKRLEQGATLTIRYNGRVISIDNQDNITYNDETNLTNINGEINSYGYVNGTTFEISFECNMDGGFEIYELRLVHGDMVLPWTQNQNELKTKYVIQSEQANTTNHLDTDGMVVTNTTTNDEVLRATDEGIITQDLTSKGKSNISGMLVQKINRTHVFITGVKESII